MAVVVSPPSNPFPPLCRQEIPPHGSTSHSTQTRSIPCMNSFPLNCKYPILIAAPTPLFCESQQADPCRFGALASPSSDDLPAVQQTRDSWHCHCVHSYAFQTLFLLVFLVGFS
ncbi:hypothetical protein TcCL_ESM00852 [Trypanosoma cruzi]|nr:hypothetical protein TcCL_ESM00852 [Trypanosoma cruzi]